MGTITANISDETEELFRKKVKETLGEGKGKLGKALDEAMKKWTEEKEQKKEIEEFLELTKKGFYKLKKNFKFSREEIYERL
ncbi:MAG: hypothetical protein QW757_00460 [Candidatus Woesearchaeota archaeon]